MDGRLFLAYPHDSGALSQSCDRLQLIDDGGSDLVSVTCLLVQNDNKGNSKHVSNLIFVPQKYLLLAY